MRAGLALLALCAVVTLALGGTTPFARVLMAAGLPGLAAPLLNDPAWKGAAYYRAGDHDSAAEAFTRARAFHNLGNAEVQRGNYAAALEAYDIAIAEGNVDSVANFDAVAAYYAGLAIDPDALAFFPKREKGPEAEGFIAMGTGRAAGTGDSETNPAGMLGALELESRGRLGVRRVFDDKFMVADERWLQQLSDVPGEYLQARISFERKRRAKLGLTPPEPEDPR